MAIQNRTTLKALIDLYIYANGNKEITADQVNEILTNIIDSTYFQLDEPRSVSDGVAFVDSINGNDGTGKVGDMSAPFSTVQEAHDQVQTGGTIQLVQGSFGSLFASKNVSVIGYGRNNCFLSGVSMTGGSITEFDIANLTLTNMIVNTASGQGDVNIQRCNINGSITGSVSGGNVQADLCSISGIAEEIVVLTNSFVTGGVETKVERGVYVADNLIQGSFLLNDRTGGRILRNTFDTGANTPINWRNGFSDSQIGGKVDIYDNDFLSSAAQSILEVAYTNLEPMTARLWNNRYETTTLYTLINNLVTRDQLNNQLT